MAFDAKLNEVQNNGCQAKCNPLERRARTQGGVCQDTASVIDGLPLRCVGAWEKDKILHLTEYVKTYAIAMKNMGGVNYVEIASGPGRCIDKKTKTEFDGTALAVLNLKESYLIHKFRFFDLSPSIVQTLETRLQNNSTKHDCKAHIGDFTDAATITPWIRDLNNRVTLFFVDPTDCSVPFQFFSDITKNFPKADIIVNFPLEMDFIRNTYNATSKERSIEKYTDWIGSDGFFSRADVRESIETKDTQKTRLLVFSETENNFRKLGFQMGLPYKVSGSKRIFYYLLFLSKNELGVKLWNQIHGRVDTNGQGLLFGS